MMVTKDGEPVEFFLTEASFADVSGLELFDFDLPEGATVYADKAYNFYLIEDNLKDNGITLQPIRKKNSTRALPAWACYLQSYHRKAVETTGSLINQLLPQSIHATNSDGFELKIVLFCLSCSINCIQLD